MTNKIFQTPIHIPKDAYANLIFFQCLECCRDERKTIDEVTEEMEIKVPQRANRVGEKEVHRDRLDFGTYMELVTKEKNESGKMEYKLTQPGKELVDCHLEEKAYQKSKEILQEHLLNYTTANEKHARELYIGHTARPFLVALQVLYELKSDPEAKKLLNNGISKKILTDGVNSVLTGSDQEQEEAIEFIIKTSKSSDSDRDRQDILSDFVKEKYPKIQNIDSYRSKTTNNPARLFEWLAKTELVKVSKDKKERWNWPNSLHKRAGEVVKIFGITSQAEKLLMKLGYTTSEPLLKRKGYSQKHGIREESDEHKLVKLLVKEFSDEVLGVKLASVSEEYTFQTGDRVDLIMKDETGRLVAVEAEVEINDGKDLAGLLQAVKYKHMLEVERAKPFSTYRTVLVAFQVHENVRKRAELYGVEVFEIDKNYLDLIDLVRD